MGGAKYVLVLVDQCTHFVWTYALQNLSHHELIAVLEEFVVDAGAAPH